MESNAVVIIGGGHSGAKAAAALRKLGWQGAISIIGEESHLPYDRPPLSKAVLLGKKVVEQCAFFPESWYKDNCIELLLGEAAARIDRDRGQVVLRSGRALPYSRLLFATGARLNPLPIPGMGLEGVLPLREPSHASTITECLLPARKVVVVGAGVIGLEVAAAAVERGCSVCVLEAAPRAMGRSVPGAVSDILVEEHRKRGVEIRFAVKIAALEGNRSVSSVMMDDGERLPCDLVVYGVGVKPRSELAAEAGLAVDDGILTSSRLQTADDRIFACGDVCRFESQTFGQTLRLENWRNAEDQAVVAARNIIGDAVDYDEVPWFWSNQFDFTLQVAGLPSLGSRTTVSAVGAAQLVRSVTEDGHLRGACAIGALRDVAGAIRSAKVEIAASRKLGLD